MSYPEFFATDRRDYRSLINVVRAAQKKNNYELAALALTIMIQATSWRNKEDKDRPVDLCLVRPSGPGEDVTFLLFVRAVFCESQPGIDTFSWARFPAHLFKGDTAARLAFEAYATEIWYEGTVDTESFPEFKSKFPRGPIPAELVHEDGCLAVVKKNRGRIAHHVLFEILNEDLKRACINRFKAPDSFVF